MYPPRGGVQLLVNFFERMSDWCEKSPHSLAPRVRNLTEKSGSGKNAPEDLKKQKTAGFSTIVFWSSNAFQKWGITACFHSSAFFSKLI